MVPEQVTTKTDVIQALLGKRCWYASCGGAAGPTFELAFGRKIPRRFPVKNDKHSEEFRKFEGEANLLVWCTWRLDNPTSPIASSDDTHEHVRAGLEQLVNADITAIDVESPAWDLKIDFSNDLRLRVFCDHLPGDPSFDGNWELEQPDSVIAVGPGSTVALESRASEVPVHERES
jgi:hypothetical protein